jgi:hypothetical protein
MESEAKSQIGELSTSRRNQNQIIDGKKEKVRPSVILWTKEQLQILTDIATQLCNTTAGKHKNVNVANRRERDILF